MISRRTGAAGVGGVVVFAAGRWLRLLLRAVVVGAVSRAGGAAAGCGGAC
ncbi:hypothetical protein [Candidatus Chloroploca asiatica]|nr:hypothetical protein [Candidatus Chloroploca asiatica]